MVKAQLKIGSYYINSDVSEDTVKVIEITNCWVFYNYVYGDTELYRDNRSLPMEIFLKCYKPNKMCNVLFRGSK